MSPVRQFGIVCKEKRGAVLRQVRQMVRSQPLYDFLWEHIKDIPNFMKATPGATTREEMERWLEDPSTTVYLIDTVGAIVVVQEGTIAHVHVTFWDRILNGREELCRELSRRVFREDNVNVLYTAIPISSRAVMAFARRVGFQPVIYRDQSMVLLLIPSDVGAPNYTV